MRIGVGFWGSGEGGHAQGAANKLKAESLCWEKALSLAPHDLVNDMGSVLCLHGHGSHVCNLKFSSIQIKDIFGSDREL